MAELADCSLRIDQDQIPASTPMSVSGPAEGAPRVAFGIASTEVELLARHLGRNAVVQNRAGTVLAHVRLLSVDRTLGVATAELVRI